MLKMRKIKVVAVIYHYKRYIRQAHDTHSSFVGNSIVFSLYGHLAILITPIHLLGKLIDNPDNSIGYRERGAAVYISYPKRNYNVDDKPSFKNCLKYTLPTIEITQDELLAVIDSAQTNWNNESAVQEYDVVRRNCANAVRDIVYELYHKQYPNLTAYNPQQNTLLGKSKAVKQADPNATANEIRQVLMDSSLDPGTPQAAQVFTSTNQVVRDALVNAFEPLGNLLNVYQNQLSTVEQKQYDATFHQNMNRFSRQLVEICQQHYQGNDQVLSDITTNEARKSKAFNVNGYRFEPEKDVIWDALFIIKFYMLASTIVKVMHQLPETNEILYLRERSRNFFSKFRSLSLSRLVLVVARMERFTEGECANIMILTSEFMKVTTKDKIKTALNGLVLKPKGLISKPELSHDNLTNHLVEVIYTDSIDYGFTYQLDTCLLRLENYVKLIPTIAKNNFFPSLNYYKNTFNYIELARFLSG